LLCFVAGYRGEICCHPRTLFPVPRNKPEDVTGIQPTRVRAAERLLSAQGLGLAGFL
jgi:hypothetical protein